MNDTDPAAQTVVRHFIVIAPNESPISLTAESWLVALGTGMQRLHLTAPMNNLRVSKNDQRTWVVEDRDTGVRYLIIDTDTDT